MKHVVRGIVAAGVVLFSVSAEASQPASGASDGSATSVPADVTMDAVGRVLSVTTPEGTTSYRYFDETNAPLIHQVTKPDGTKEQYSLDVAAGAYHALLGSAASSSSNSNPCLGTNRFGFNGYLWECELGLFLTPSGRLYDPELGRFLQQDAYLGDVVNPPSLHRYTFGHNNPTSFIDPTGHVSYRQWILLDKPSADFGHEFLKHVGYNAFNLVSFGALARQDTLVEQSEAGTITEGQYQRGTSMNAVGTGATAAATFATGGVAGQIVARAGGSLVLAGAASGGAAGLVASTGSADVDMATGMRSPLDVHPTEFVAPTVLGAATGAAFGAGAASGVRPFAGPVRGPPPSLDSSRGVVVAEGTGGAYAADQIRLLPATGPVPVATIRGRANPIGEQGPFLVSPAGVARTQRGITRLERRGFLEFEGMEVRGARDLAHVPEATLRAMQKRGFAARDTEGQPLILHHLEQNPAGPLVEIPAPRHSIANRQQHPVGNAPGAGLSPEQRLAFDAWRVEYWKARAGEELARRGVQ